MKYPRCLTLAGPGYPDLAEHSRTAIGPDHGAARRIAREALETALTAAGCRFPGLTARIHADKLRLSADGVTVIAVDAEGRARPGRISAMTCAEFSREIMDGAL